MPASAADIQRRARRQARAARGSLDDPVDLTSMIDVTFLLLIFFMVTSALAVRAQVALPEARHIVAVDPYGATVITLREPTAADAHTRVLLGDASDGRPATDDEIRARVEEQVARGFRDVFIKAERRVPHRDVLHVARVVSAVPGARMHFAVREKR